MSTLPSRDVLRSEFDVVIDELDRARPGAKLTTDWYRSIGDAVFDAGYRALGDTCAAQATTNTQGAPEAQAKPRLQVVSAPVGSGKTSFSVAFITAVVRLAELDSTAPYGGLFVVDQMAKADEMFGTLNTLLPGRVAVWSTDHDPKCTKPTKVFREDRPRFSKDDLQRYPVAVVTNKFFAGKGGHKARQVRRGDRLVPRALTVMDEQIDEVTLFEVELSSAERVRELVQQDEKTAETIGPHMNALVRFMSDRSLLVDGRDLEKPTDNTEAWSIANQLDWFDTVHASAFVKANHRDPDVARVFGFARSLAQGYAFIARNMGGSQGTYFIGYERSLVIDPGTLLLDATADIDGVSQLCPWREHATTPKARYDNLTIVHVPTNTERKRMRLSNYFKLAKNRRDYVKWMEATITEHMTPGQRGFVVCKKTLFEK